MERTYSSFYGFDEKPSKGAAGNSANPPVRGDMPKSPHVSRVNRMRGSEFTTLPRSPKSQRERQQQLQQLHADNERLCDSVSETYMVRLKFTTAYYSILWYVH